MATRGTGRSFFPLTSLQIGDLQSYRSYLSLFTACESKKLFILVDNRPWLFDLNSRIAQLWQIMVTKSRLSPFANIRPRRPGRERNDIGKRLDYPRGSSRPISKRKKIERWLTLVTVALLSQPKVLFPVNTLRKIMLLRNELRRTLYGFIVFEVSWSDVRGINYLNELQTDTSTAIEAKCMKRWEFESIEQASSCISSWFSGTQNESLIFQDCLDSIIGEVFYDAKDHFTSDPAGEGEIVYSDDECGLGKHAGNRSGKFSVFSASEECKSSMLQTPSPRGAYRRRKLIEPVSPKAEVCTSCEEIQSEIFGTPRYAETSTPTNTSDHENTVEAIDYKDVFILFRFNDHDLPFKLRDMIMSDVRLLTLLEAGLPSWVIFLQSYPVFCHFYRPWMCPLVRALYVMVSVVTVLIGFYDLYKNVPVLKATASSLFGPLFDWIETWEMISRIKYLGTMLFLHNFEKALRWFLMFTRAVRSFVAIITQPVAGTLEAFTVILLPFWNTLLQTVESFGSVVWVAIESSCSLVQNVVQVVFLPVWLILSVIWRTASTIIYPVVLALYQLLYAPIRLVLQLASFLASMFSYSFDLLQEFWLSISNLIKLASASKATVSTYEVSVWRSLWNDLFSQIFRAVRSILNGFVAFFAACNRHRLSIYNHSQECLRRFFHTFKNVPHRRQRRDHSHRRWEHREVHSPTAQLEWRKPHSH